MTFLQKLREWWCAPTVESRILDITRQMKERTRALNDEEEIKPLTMGEAFSRNWIMNNPQPRPSEIDDFCHEVRRTLEEMAITGNDRQGFDHCIQRNDDLVDGDPTFGVLVTQKDERLIVIDFVDYQHKNSKLSITAMRDGLVLAVRNWEWETKSLTLDEYTLDFQADEARFNRDKDRDSDARMVFRAPTNVVVTIPLKEPE